MDEADSTRRAQLDESVRSALARGDADAAATLALEGYGPEVYGFLTALHKGSPDADDAFSELGLSLWRGLPRFDWRCSLRTFVYVLARHASHHVRRAEKRHGARQAGLDSSLASRVAAAVRTRTASYLAPPNVSAFQALRDELDEEDRVLLGLRVDRGLEWADIARVLAAEELDAASLKRESARLRKRFQSVKDRLRRLGVERGLIDGEPR